MSGRKFIGGLIRGVALPTACLAGLVIAGFFAPQLWDPAAASESLRRVWISRAFQICLWLSGAVALHRWVSLLILDGLASQATGRPVPKIFKDVLAVVFLLAAVAGILVTVFNQSVAGFWAASGVLGIVLGIALRPIILDFFSGLGANLEQAYNIGDWITVAGNPEPIRGWIEEINWRTLRIRTRDGFIVLVPNSRLATSAVVNHSMPQPESRFQLRVRLDTEVLPDRALRILGSAANAATAAPDGPRRLPAPDVLITDASCEGIEYVVRYWLDPSCESPDTVLHTVWTCVLAHLSKAGLSFAHPKEQVYVGRMPRIAGGFNELEDRLAFLRKVALFQGFPEDSLRILAGEARLRSVRADHVLVRAGDCGDSMFLVAEGTLRVLGDVGPDGGAVELAVLQPGAVLGERSLLTGEPRSASVVAITESVILEITREALQILLTREPGLLRALEETVMEREHANQARTDAASLAGRGNCAVSRTQAFISRMRELFAGVAP